MKMKKLILSSMVLLMISASGAQAQSVPELMRALEDQIVTLDQAMSEETPAESPAVRSEVGTDAKAAASEEMYFLQNFFLRIRARWGFDVPGFVKFHVVPEIELLWQRTPPEGWGSYKP